MKTSVMIFALVLGISFWGCMVLVVSGCNRGSNAETASRYQAEQLYCIEQAKDIETSRNCRAQVMAKYGRSMDGGAE